MPSYDYFCEKCMHKSIYFMRFDDREQTQVCEICEGPATYTIGAPTLRTSDSASWVDGTKRDDTYQKLKEASKLRVQAASMPENKRGEIRKEIKKLGARPDV